MMALLNLLGIENRKIGVIADFSSYALEYPELDLPTSFSKPIISAEFVAKLAQDIVQHFESRQKNWVGKGVVIVPDIKTGVALSQEIAVINPNWRGDTEFTGSVKAISASESPTQRANLFERFRKRDDSLSLLIATGSFLVGYDNPLIHTIYVTNPVSLQLRYLLASLVSRSYQGKEDGLIVDYMGLNWDLE